MPKTFTINNLDYANQASGNQTYTVKYKRFDANSYTTASANVVVNTAGQVLSPLAIPNLSEGIVYHFMVSNNGCPSQVYIQEVEII